MDQRTELMDNTCNELDQCIRELVQFRDHGHVAVLVFQHRTSREPEEESFFKDQMRTLEEDLKKILLHYIRIDGRVRKENGEETEEVSFLLSDTQTRWEFSDTDLLLLIRDYYICYGSNNGAIIWNPASRKVIFCNLSDAFEPEICKEAFLAWPQSLPDRWMALRELIPGMESADQRTYEWDSYEPHLSYGYTLSSAMAALHKRKVILNDIKLKKRKGHDPLRLFSVSDEGSEKVPFDEAFRVLKEGGRFAEIMGGAAILLKTKKYLILSGARADLYATPYLYEFPKTSAHRQDYSEHIVFSPVTPEEAIMIYSKAACLSGMEKSAPQSFETPAFVERFPPFPKEEVFRDETQTMDHKGRRNFLLRFTE